MQTVSTFRHPLRIVAIGGGTGLPVVLRGLKAILFPTGTGDPDRLVGVVTVTDDGGSSGKLRDELGVLPPGDIRNCLVALSHNEPLMSKVFQARYRSKGSLDGHALGNLILAGLAQQQEGCFLRAIQLASEVLNIQGRVLPSTLKPTTLVAQMMDGRTVSGESSITNCPAQVERIRLEPETPEATQGVVDALMLADIVVLGPGSLFTSILPNLVIPEIAEALRTTEAFRVLVVNAMTEMGETEEFTVSDHVRALYHHSGTGLIDAVLVPSEQLPEQTLERYQRENSKPVPVDHNILSRLVPMVIPRELLEFTPKVRHDSVKTAAAILSAYAEWSGRMPTPDLQTADSESRS